MLACAEAAENRVAGRNSMKVLRMASKLNDRMQLLTTPEEVDEFLRVHPDSAIFKVGVCFKTPEVLVHIQAHLDDREDIPVGCIRVLEDRPASDHVAKITKIRHESPQLIFFRDRKAAFDSDNWDITDQAISEAVQAHFSEVVAKPS